MIKNKSILLILTVTIAIAVLFVVFGILGKNNSKQVFESDGYVLTQSSENSDVPETYYFSKGAAFRNKFPDLIEFTDNAGNKITVSENSFIHFADGSISSFSNGVVLKTNKSTNDKPLYYNIPAYSVMKFNETDYILDNAGNPITFTDFVWKLTDEKIMIVSSNIDLKISQSSDERVVDFIETRYLDEAVIQMTTKDNVWYSAYNNCLATLDDGTAVNFSNQLISCNEDSSIEFKNMIVGSDANATVRTGISNSGIIPKFDITTIDGEKGADGEDGTEGEAGKEGITGTEGKSGVDGSSGAGGGAGSAGSIGKNGNTGGSGEEPPQDIVIPFYKLSNWECAASAVKGSISITDDDARLTTGVTVVSVVGSGTNETLISQSYTSMMFDFEFTGLTPNNQYRLVAIAEYEVNGKNYTREFISKVFITDSVGLTMSKNYATQEELSFNIVKESYSTVTSAMVELMHNGQVIATQNIAGFNSDNTATVTFMGSGTIEPNKEYTAQLTNIVYEGTLGLDTYGDPIKVMTLKTMPTLGQPLIVTNQKNASFEVQLSNVTDPDNGIMQYRYELYSQRSAGTGADPVKVLKSENTYSVAFLVDNANIRRGDPYFARVIAEFNDNEKVIEISSTESEVVVMNGTKYPTIRFEQDSVTFNSLEGTLFIDLTDSEITIDSLHPLQIVYKNEFGDGSTYKIDDNGYFTKTLTTIAIPINVDTLRATSNYSLGVYGYVDINDGNGMQYGFIGSDVILIPAPNPFRARFAQNADDLNNSISIDFNLSSLNTPDDNLYEANSLYSLTFLLFAGSDTTGTPLKTITKYNTYASHTSSTLKDTYYENPQKITEAFFGLASSQLTATNYTIMVSKAYDYSEELRASGNVGFSNNIPIENNTFTISKTNAPPPLPVDKNNALYVVPMENADLPNYGEPKRANYLDTTVFGFKGIQAYYDNSAKLARTFTYFIYDTQSYDAAIAAGQEPQYIASYTMDVLLSGAYGGTVPKLNIIFGAGTNYKDSTGTVYTVYSENMQYNGSQGITNLDRGRQYYLAYTAELQLNDRQDGILIPYYKYPQDYENGAILRSQKQDAPFEAPTLMFYPWDSDATSSTWKASVSDIDNALVSDKYTLRQGSNIISYESIAINPPGLSGFTDLVLSGLSQGNMQISVNQNLYVYSTTEQSMVLINQYFEGIKQDIGVGIKYTVEANKNNHLANNRIYIKASGTLEQLNKVMALEMQLTASGVPGIVIYQKFDSIECDDGTNAVGNVYLNLAEIASMANKTISVSIRAMMDTGISGFKVFEEDNAYAAMQYVTDTAMGQYTMLPSSNGNLVDIAEANGSLFSKMYYSVNSTSGVISSTVKSMVYTTPTSQPANYRATSFGARKVNSSVNSTLKKAYRQQIQCTALDDTSLGNVNTIQIALGSIVPSVNLRRTTSPAGWNIVNGVNSASITMDIKGADDPSIVQDKQLHVELYKNDKTSGYEYVNRDISMNITEGQTHYTFLLDNLEYGTAYAFKLYVYLDGTSEKSYLFDLYWNRSNDVYYDIFTLANFNINFNSLSFIYNSYNDKFIRLDYRLDQRTGFDLRFDIYKIETDSTETLWLNNDMMKFLGIIPTYSSYTNDMITDIKWTPQIYDTLKQIQGFGDEYANPLDVNQKYKLKIRAFVSDDPNETSTLASMEYVFILNPLKTPIFTVQSIPGATDGPDNSKQFSIAFRAVAVDSNKSVVNGKYRVKMFDDTGKDITPDVYKQNADGSSKLYDVADLYNDFILDDTTLAPENILTSQREYRIAFFAVYDMLNTGKDAQNNNIDGIESMLYGDLTLGGNGGTIAAKAVFSEETLNDYGLRMGTVSAVAMPGSPTKIRLNFNDSVNLSLIKNVEYTVYSSSGQSFGISQEPFTIYSAGGDNFGKYYYFNLDDITLPSRDTYSIMMYYYNEAGTLVGQTLTKYNY